MEPTLGEVGCGLLSIMLMVFLLDFIVRNERRPPSRRRLYGLTVAWCILASFPFIMALAYFAATWPYGGDSSFRSGFKWGPWIAVALVGFGAVCGLAVCIAYVISHIPEGGTGPSGPPLPYLGPRWADRQLLPPRRENIQHPPDQVSEGNSPDSSTTRQLPCHSE